MQLTGVDANLQIMHSLRRPCFTISENHAGHLLSMSTNTLCLDNFATILSVWMLDQSTTCNIGSTIHFVDKLQLSENETTLGPPNSCKFCLTALVLTTDFLKDSQKTPRSKRKAIHIPLKKKTKDCRPTFRIKRLVNITCSSRQNFVANWHSSENTKKGFTWPSCKRVTLQNEVNLVSWCTRVVRDCFSV